MGTLKRRQKGPAMKRQSARLDHVPTEKMFFEHMQEKLGESN